MNPDPYEVLGVAPEADLEAIKARYRLLVREHHPDMAQDKEEANSRMVIILEAWRTLSDPDRRSRLDAQRANAQRPAPSAPTVPVVARPSHLETQPRRAPAPGSRSVNPKGRLLRQVNEAAQLYHREGRAEEAIDLCRRVLKSEATNVEAITLMGDIRAAQGDLDTARLMYDRALLLQPGNLLIRRKREDLPTSASAEEISWRPPAEAAHGEPSPATPGFFERWRARRHGKE